MRAINEACTEKLAIDIFGEVGATTAFQSNVDALNEIEKALKKLGYDNAIFYTYYGTDKTILPNLIDSIGGKGMYNDICFYMDIADGSSNVVKNVDISQTEAENCLMSIVGKFCRRVDELSGR